MSEKVYKFEIYFWLQVPRIRRIIRNETLRTLFFNALVFYPLQKYRYEPQDWLSLSPETQISQDRKQDKRIVQA